MPETLRHLTTHPHVPRRGAARRRRKRARTNAHAGMFAPAPFAMSRTANDPGAPQKVASGRTAMPGHRSPGGGQEELAINTFSDKDASQNNCADRRTGGMAYGSRRTDTQETQPSVLCSGPQVGRLATEGLSREAGWQEDRVPTAPAGDATYGCVRPLDCRDVSAHTCMSKLSRLPT